MAQTSEIVQFCERRRLLVAESDRLRRQVAAEVANLSGTVLWIERGYSLVRAARSLWPLLAAAAGFLAARPRAGWWRWVARLWSLWPLVKDWSARLWKTWCGSR